MKAFRNITGGETVDRAVLFTVLVAALGYFVDIFDLLLFSIVRVQSLKDLGVPESDLLDTGIRLINMQMAGLLIGGVVWGMVGDRLGRISVLFGSILLYSLANIANGFAATVDQYAWLRFIAGIGLAGELGAGVTLASELLPGRWRGLGTTFIASIGVAGAMAAATISDLTGWRTAYMVGGAMGLCLLVMRLKVHESGMFKRVEAEQDAEVSRGNILMLLKPRLLKRYLAVIMVGAPLWGMIGLFITFTPEFAKDMGMADPLPTAGKAVFFSYLGLVFGDAFIGLLSQKLKSRKKAVGFSLAMMTASLAVYVLLPGKTLEIYYALCLLLGFSVGYWCMFVQMAAEQFGTNIRATATTTVPNFVRAITIPATAAFGALKSWTYIDPNRYEYPVLGVTESGLVVMAVLTVLAAISLYTLDETFGKDLDYIEK